MTMSQKSLLYFFNYYIINIYNLNICEYKLAFGKLNQNVLIIKKK